MMADVETLMSDPARDAGFRWRGANVSRLEGLSDAVFGFAITLLVVSLEVPRSFTELVESMRGLGAFAISFAILFATWHNQYLWFRRYGLEDRATTALNAALLFLVVFYVYPLKFLMSAMVAVFRGANTLSGDEWSGLLRIYSLGFITISVMFILLYRHAWRRREALQLNAAECLETRHGLIEHAIMVSIGTLAYLTALSGGRGALVSGMEYLLIPIALTTLRAMRRRERARLGQDSER